MSTDVSGNGITRLAYTENETKAHAYIASEAGKIGLKATTDSAGNSYVRLGEGEKIIRFGSHLDSVNNGGNYDGAVGVIAGLEALRCLAQAKVRLNYAVELVVFRAEESTRFNMGCIASQIVTGKITEKEAKMLKDKDKISLHNAIKDCGFSPERFKKAFWEKNKVEFFVEPHIEQARVLETEQTPIGIVSGIAAPVRFILSVEGVYDHSGATPMNMRRDAVAAASEMILLAEKVGKDAFNNSKSTVVTVGNINVPNGSINKIAGKCIFYLDIRDINKKDRDDAEKKIMADVKKIAEKRKVRIIVQETQRSEPAILDEKVKALLAKAADSLGVRHRLLISGAAQDAQHISNYGIPTGMIFVPSKEGISHSPEEFTEIKHIAIATKILINALIEGQTLR